MTEGPLLVEKVLGVRHFLGNEGVLRSIFAAYDWVPGENRARCTPIRYGMFGRKGAKVPGVFRTHAAPVNDCECGLYAYHPQHLQPVMNWCGGNMVLGAVLGWGRMEVHRTGWRAQFAEVVLVTDAEFAAAYGVPRVPYRDLDEALASGEYGYPVPGSMWPTTASDEQDHRD